MGDFVGSAVGEIKILEVNQDGKFVRLVNEGKQVIYHFLLFFTIIALDKTGIKKHH